MASLTSSHLPRVLVFAALALSSAAPTFAAGGTVCLVTDNTADGYYYSLSGTGSDRFISEYFLTDSCFAIDSIICGARLRELDQGNPPFGTMGGDLRSEDAANPGYPDLGPAGLIV